MLKPLFDRGVSTKPAYRPQNDDEHTIEIRDEPEIPLMSSEQRQVRGGKNGHTDGIGPIGPSGISNDRKTKFAEHTALHIWEMASKTILIMWLSISSITIGVLVSDLAQKIIDDQVPSLVNQCIVIGALIVFFMLVVVLLVVRQTTLRQQQFAIDQNKVIAHVLSHSLMPDLDITQEKQAGS